jgi:hypothetical protein
VEQFSENAYYFFLRVLCFVVKHFPGVQSFCDW